MESLRQYPEEDSFPGPAMVDVDLNLMEIQITGKQADFLRVDINLS